MSGVILLAALIFLGTTADLEAQRREIVVSAASSLTDVLGQVGRAYEAIYPDRVVLNLGASNTLARQITAGAPVDLFISADEAQMDVVRGQVIPGTRAILLANQLVVAVPADRPPSIRGPRDLLAPSIRRIAIGDPAAVPAGVYAWRYLQRSGVADALRPKLVPTTSVRLALAAVESGAVDAGIVFKTDLATTRRATLSYAIPTADTPAIRYPAALIVNGGNREGARRFLAYLNSAAAAAIFRSAGFIIP